MSQILSKPPDYEKWEKIGPPYSKWPRDCFRFRDSMMEYKRSHTECQNMTPDEIVQYKKQLRLESSKKSMETLKKKISSMTDEERKAFNKKKGSYYNNMSPEEKLKHNEVLRKRSQNFWDGMSKEERDRFGKYRESFITEEQRKERIRKWSDGAKKWAKEHPKEAAAIWKKAHSSYMAKFSSDPKFREEQINLLRKHNNEYFRSLSKEEYEKWKKKFLSRSAEVQREKWKNDPEWRKKRVEHCRSIAGKYMSMLTPEERAEHMRKLTERAMNTFGDEDQLRRIITNNRLNQKFEDRFRGQLSDEFEFHKERLVQFGRDFKSWDYVITRKGSPEPIMYLDLDGSYWHADTHDYDGLYSSERRDEQRHKFTTVDVPITIISEITFDDGFREMTKILHMENKGYQSYRFSQYRSIGFPFPVFTDDRIVNDLRRLKYSPNVISLENHYGESMIINFHKSLWCEAQPGFISPIEAWYDDQILSDMILCGELHRGIFDYNKITQGFNISEFARRVSILPPSIVCYLIQKYLSDAYTIFDPFCYHSSIMIGASILNRSYIGLEYDDIRLCEDGMMIEFLYRHKNDIGINEIPLVSKMSTENSTAEHANLLTYIDCLECPDIVIRDYTKRYQCNRFLFVAEKKPIEFPIVETIQCRTFGGTKEKYVVYL